MWSAPIDTRIRAVIFHEGKILLMRLKNSSYFSLPWGGWEAPENSHECLTREIVEELGVCPKIGDIAATNEFRYKDQPCNELWYFIDNGNDFLDISKLWGTHSHEFEELHWFDWENLNISIKPDMLQDALYYWKIHGKIFYQK